MPGLLRVAQMVYTFHVEKGGGGVTRSAIDIAQKLDPARFQVTVFSLGTTDTLAEKKWVKGLQAQGIRAFAAADWVESQPYRSFWRAYQNLYSDLKEHPVDILHSHSEFTDIAALFLKLQGMVRRIIRTTHYGYPVEWRTKPWRRLLFSNLLFPLCYDCEVGVNPTIRDRLNRRWMARRMGRTALFINETVQIERFQERSLDRKTISRMFGVPEDAFLVGSVGRLAEQKGHIYLLQAAAQLIQTYPKARFLVIGDGPLANDLANQAACLGLGDKVIFTGSRTDVDAILPGLDLFVLASLWEGMPISVLESMAAGAPVLATDVAGTRDLIKHGVNGWLFPPADPQALAQAIAEMITHPERRSSLARAARQTAEEYSSAAVARRYAEIYTNLVRV